MVSTRSPAAPMTNGTANGAAGGPAPDPNRIIAIVTGANSGFGLGLCHELLRELSTPCGKQIPAAKPRMTAIAAPLLPSLEAEAEKLTDPEADDEAPGLMPDPHPTLTLILACRSQANADEAKAKIIEEHKYELAKRSCSYQKIPVGWEEGLRIETELVDLDCIGGDRGVISFSRRIAAKYPHVTSLFLNAGYAAITQVGIPGMIAQVFTHGLLHALHHPRYNIEAVGARSADGERGKVWGINVLAPYILTKELAPLLRKSPRQLPFEPRVVYTSSIEAEAESLNDSPKEDYQLLEYKSSYRASKYMGDLVFTQLDRELGVDNGGQQRPVRCLIAEPGCVATNIAVAGFGAWAWLVQVKWVCYWLAFWFANLIGSPHHPVWASYGAFPMLYAAFIADRYLMPPTKLPGQKMHVVARRWKLPSVKYGEVDDWDKNADLAAFVADKCDSIRLDWHKREPGPLSASAP